MRRLCFVVNVDWFFDSHRRPLERKLSSKYDTSIIAGDSGFKADYRINTFEVNSRVPTLRGVYEFYKEVKNLDRSTIIVIVSPVMILLSHLLLKNRRKVFYNFSGLGFIRSKKPITRNVFMFFMKVFPVSGNRIFVVQNCDDFEYFKRIFKSKKNFYIEIIPGSGYEPEEKTIPEISFKELTIGYVGRIRKDKGVLDLLRTVVQLKEEGFGINLKIWGNLDEHNRHGFNDFELEELNKYSHYFQGFSHDKREIFKSFNWFCLPSNGEGLSKAAIEAASFGLPLLLSNVEGNRDMINGNGFLFEYGDAVSLKSCLNEILNLSEGEVQNMSVISRSMFEANWTLDSVYNKWNHLLIKYDTFST